MILLSVYCKISPTLVHALYGTDTRIVLEMTLFRRHEIGNDDKAGSYLRGEVTGPNPLRNYDEKILMCPSVCVFHISVQWSFNVDQFMQIFDSQNGCCQVLDFML